MTTTIWNGSRWDLPYTKKNLYLYILPHSRQPIWEIFVRKRVWNVLNHHCVSNHLHDIMDLPVIAFRSSSTSLCHHHTQIPRHDSWQNLSLSQENEFAHEFTFVALFRVGKLGHIAFNGGFELERLMQINGARSSKGTWVRQRWEDDIMIITDRTKDWFNGQFWGGLFILIGRGTEYSASFS